MVKFLQLLLVVIVFGGHKQALNAPLALILPIGGSAAGERSTAIRDSNFKGITAHHVSIVCEHDIAG
jgi:hypothetical protein